MLLDYIQIAALFRPIDLNVYLRLYICYFIERLSRNKIKCSGTIKIQMAFIIYNRYLYISDCISDDSIERMSHLHKGY